MLVSCKKDINLSVDENSLSFSVDTLLFDTVFTNVGSATRYLKIYNNSTADLNLNNVRLGKGAGSSFRINVDGVPGYNIEETLIRGGDSLYIFADVTIDPNDAQSAFIETDSILFQYENYTQHVKLRAWGRNAYYYSSIPDHQQYTPNSENLQLMEWDDFFDPTLDPNNENIGTSFYYYSINTPTQWTDEKPHVIYGNLIVENNQTLNITAGAEIYLHTNSSISITEGSSIHAKGDLDNEITFQSDRSDNHSLTDYAHTPGQWGGIWIRSGSFDNIFDYVKMKNGQVGIRVDGIGDPSVLSALSPESLTITNSIIYNMSGVGIWALSSKVVGSNLLIANCGSHLLSLVRGGYYDFKQCTFVNAYPFERSTSSIAITNYFPDTPTDPDHYGSLQKGYFGNCIIDGNLETEIILGKDEEKANFNYTLDHCIVKANSTDLTAMDNNWSDNFIHPRILSNQENCGISNFEQNDLTMSKYDFYLTNNSPARNAGSISIVEQNEDIWEDMDQNDRTKNPDIGCFEKQ